MIKLPNRAAITVTGPDRFAFLQNLITNDIEKARDGIVYACLLTPQGKFLFDFFIREQENALLIDCEGGDRAETLLKKLQLYKLRSKVELTLTDNVPVFAAFEEERNTLKDPRHPGIGWRYYGDAEETDPFEVWDLARIKLCIPDGSRDMIPEKSTMLESRIDTLNGVDFKKGCYVGQELTARMHYRGLAKKHLYAIEFPTKADLDKQTDLYDSNGKLMGEMRSHCQNYGIALLKDSTLEQQDLPFTIL